MKRASCAIVELTLALACALPCTVATTAAMAGEPTTPMPLAQPIPWKSIGPTSPEPPTRTYFGVAASTRALTAAINREIVASVDFASDATITLSCGPEILTDRFVSWSCTGDGGGAGSFSVNESRAFYLDGDKLRVATLADLFAAPEAKVLERVNALAKPEVPYEADALGMIAVTASGIRIGPSFAPPDQWQHLRIEDLKLPLAANNPWRFEEAAAKLEPPAEDERAARYEAAAKRLQAMPGRFEARDGTVFDATSDLEWSAADNGADVDFAGAADWVKALRAGGHDDWRLPTLPELAALQDPIESHKDKSDCFAGRYAVMLSPLVRASCVIMWSGDVFVGADDKPIRGQHKAFGFVFARVWTMKDTTTKSMRVLAVRAGKR